MTANFDHFFGVDEDVRRTLNRRLFSLIDWLELSEFESKEANAILLSQKFFRDDAPLNLDLEQAHRALGRTISRLPVAHAIATAFPNDHPSFDLHNLLSIRVILAVLRERQIDSVDAKPHEEALRAVRALREQPWGEKLLRYFDPNQRDLKAVLDRVNKVIDDQEFSGRQLKLIQHIRVVLTRMYEQRKPYHTMRDESLPIFKYQSELLAAPELLEPDETDARVRIIKTATLVDEAGAAEAISPDFETHSDLYLVDPVAELEKKSSIDFRRRFSKGAVNAMHMRQCRAQSLWHGFTTSERQHLLKTCISKMAQKPNDDTLYYLEFFLSLFLGRSIEALRNLELLDIHPQSSENFCWWSRENGKVSLNYCPDLPSKKLRKGHNNLLQGIKIKPLSLQVPAKLNDLAVEYLWSAHRLMADPVRIREVWNSIWKNKPRIPSIGRLKDEVFHTLMARKHDSAFTSHIIGQSPKHNPALYYSTIEVDELAQEHFDIERNLIGHENSLPPLDGFVGSSLQASQNMLRNLFPALRKFASDLRKSPALNLREFHNIYTAITFLILAFATAHRPVRAPFENHSDFDVDGGWLYIDDKHVRHVGASRVIPLTQLAVDQFKHWCRHLSTLFTKLSEPEGEVGMSISNALSGKDFLMFFWEENGPQIVTPGKLKTHLESVFPLPLNWPRHYWRTILRGKVSDESMNTLMGHTELFGAPFAPGSMLSLNDLEPLRETMNREIVALGGLAVPGLTS